MDDEDTPCSYCSQAQSAALLVRDTEPLYRQQQQQQQQHKETISNKTKFLLSIKSHLEADIDTLQSVISKMLIWHNGAEVVECCCGQIINGNHQCTKDMTSTKLCVTSCGYRTERGYNPLREINLDCVVCQKDTEQKKFDSQWTVNLDGYDVCSMCNGKCPYGELPKQDYGCDCSSDSD